MNDIHEILQKKEWKLLVLTSAVKLYLFVFLRYWPRIAFKWERKLFTKYWGSILVMTEFSKYFAKTFAYNEFLSVRFL